ncbi:aspartate--ammonia ligase [Loigolactobacillus coryniformis]|jgi:aspartate--ammonia ligase|uniref:Aspartate--ammonia ligase n=2 Tax=Loigolactobacillus coryniformis TaxID=1610 RepID=A0A0R1FAS1_9LACO|nr:aspartate--ammonia ligase [Loigolactobacillus coryniformis]OEH90792.1 asparagine synthetase A [Loigolactobacillus coryniformis subsp. coryniformis]ATO56045.1 aspartate--ammonia ligase [Loigolactobacillus coryniformis subsp. coryniformis KCTC 3167 = DSM 20001]KRK18758.1 asparagine synthetase AsnA [Loigolactobacillus coryniformis subsp. coryniformis KCTC 3167 = DSM 20001]MBW4803061.1 aspartate--ammonia ligase [Loigolactobacillus coryniformis subsp. torquens]MBW4805756.1 aspartate--ammonia lig
MHLIIPTEYDPKLSVRQTQEAIRYIRETFQDEFGKQLNLSRVSAPMMVDRATGLNDNLNGIESPVSFTMKDMPTKTMEIVHSLAKWKRNALGRFGFQPGEGLYTNMNAIRKDEDLDNFHSIYVDQWDWEKVITKEERTIATLQQTVRQIFKVIKHMEHEVWYKYPNAVHHLPDEIHFVTTQELEDRWPDKTPMEREDLIAKEFGCVFIMQIGGALKSGKRHDGRAPDYDDWSLNGDLIFWYEPLDCKLEISSMGIRVDEVAMAKQLKIAGAEDRLHLPFHQKIMHGELPYSIGGGIGQSRLCMLLLGKAHVGEVQASVWPQEMLDECAAHDIHIL